MSRNYKFKSELWAKVSHLLLGVAFGLTVMTFLLYTDTSKKEAKLSQLSFNNGCVFVSSKFNRNVDYSSYCLEKSLEIEDNYEDISFQMETINGKK